MKKPSLLAATVGVVLAAAASLLARTRGPEVAGYEMTTYQVGFLRKGPAFTPGETSLGDSLGHDEPAYGSAEARAALQPLLARLSDRERLMLRKRFFEDATQAEIGEALGVTQMQVSRMLSSLMARLRDEMIEE